MVKPKKAPTTPQARQCFYCPQTLSNQKALEKHWLQAHATPAQREANERLKREAEEESSEE